MLPDHVRTLDDLAAFLERATTGFEVFGNDPEGKFLHYVGICHPDRYLAAAEQAKAAKVFQQLVRWRAVARQAKGPQTIGSPSRTYEIITRLATGDLADVELAVADGIRYVLKITRPVGGNGLITSEARHLKALVARCGDRRYREYLPKWVETLLVPGENRQANVFVYREGFHTLEQVRRQHPNGLDARHLAWIFKRLLSILGFSHTCGLVHGAVVPPHVMVHAENHGLQLLDWIHATQIGSPLTFLPTTYRAWYPSEVLLREAVGPATDIFLAAKCLIYVAGGDPIAEKWPATVPLEMQRFVNTCLFAAPRMRPQDAWQLYEEFDELLVRLFGSPKYHQLVMS